MFENLDDIDWASYGHRIEIPKYIRQLLSEDHQERVIALGYLFGYGQDFGYPEPVTPHIIPFVFEVLAVEEYAEKILLLEALATVCNIVPILQGSISHLRLIVAIHASIEEGFQLCVKLLDSDDENIRGESISLLSCMQGKIYEVLENLIRHHEIETSSEIRIHIIDCMTSMIIKTRKMFRPETEKYLEFLINIVRNGEFLAERAAASIELIYLQGSHLWNEEFINTISQTLFQAVKESDSTYEKIHFARGLSHFDIEILQSFLEDDLSLLETHLLIKALLDNYYLTPSYRSSDLYRQYQHPIDIDNNGIFYSPVGFDFLFKKNKKVILPTVVNNNKYWDLPTNLLSTFFGLPDDREALHAYLGE